MFYVRFVVLNLCKFKVSNNELVPCEISYNERFALSAFAYFVCGE